MGFDRHHASHSDSHHEHEQAFGQANKQNLWIAFAITGSWMLIEFVGGLFTNSLALLADAGHMLSDWASLGLSLLAITLAQKAATAKRTYGFYRSEILAAFVNGLMLLIIALYILYEAIQRFMSPPEVASGLMMGIAAVGLVCNLLSMWVLMRGDTRENLNVRSAFVHVLGDALGSVGAVVAGILIFFFGWFLADPVASIFIALLIFISGFRIVRDAVHILMEGTPPTIDLEEVEKCLTELEGVVQVHDLHVWTITSGIQTLTCHLVIDENYKGQSHDILVSANRWIHDHLGIEHSTIQIEERNLQELEHSKI